MILHTQHCSPVSIRTREDEVREAGYAFLREGEQQQGKETCVHTDALEEMERWEQE